MSFLSTPSPLQQYIWRDRKFYIKRDDLLHPFINGNKARKFESLLNVSLTGKILLSYGGHQSNSMLALSYISSLKGCNFVYITNPLSNYLKENPKGNFAIALHNGMYLEFCKGDIGVLRDRAYEICRSLGEKVIFIPQGGACQIASLGINKLALELFLDIKDLKNPMIFCTSGSGTSAAYLGHYLPNVYTTPACGDKAYLRVLLNSICFGTPVEILSLKTKPPFAKPDIRLYKIYEEWLKLGVEFDLIYDCLGWLCLSEHMKLFEDREIVFIHSGGLSGNGTQKERYKKAGII
ncbi:hypothetical protein [Helicobacter sp. 13S00477-4]|uniref:hypothetical protein n=1 Tax=Helicobacter sp. 13S00477-4 TaxID=1905759 RepID=UPI000BA75035|nr:hypothetical protein [Helicobacter sp. 13S00477-4]PAF52551.1 hypothetical protein BKH44_01870 [Helicobacter sp. 13S00477-4]